MDDQEDGRQLLRFTFYYKFCWCDDSSLESWEMRSCKFLGYRGVDVRVDGVCRGISPPAGAII